MGESRNAYRVLVGRPEGRRPLGMPRRRWEDNIKMDLRGVGYDDRDWINLAQDRDQWRAYVRAAMNLRVNELRKSVEFISSEFDSLREELAHTRHELYSTQEEMKRLVQENDHLKQEVSDLQQYTRRDNIMLFGVPEIDEQSTYEAIDQISEVIGGSELVQHDVSVAHRIPSRPGKTRPIVIRFTKSRSRDEWLQLFRNEAKNDGSGPGIATKKVNRDLPAGRITAGDQLTAVTRDLLNKTRVASKDEASPVSKITHVDDVNNFEQTTATMTTLSIHNDWLASNYTRTHRHTASQSSQWTGQKRGDAEKRFTVDQHVNREKHKRGLQAGERKKQQMLLGQCTSANSANSVFYEKLCQAFVSANIPFHKLNNNVFRDFLQKYTGKSIPDESTIRKNYIGSCYNKTIDAIRAKLDGKKIWV
ncbi:hypothetical protein ANN_08017 [Periplaneta americana]|uniref:Uncharacterized protein n=1 Tax=Periplaneta americana TaxID=6978 RepID=A0ABQ8T082_PERAM|nr:hypothetical protein ANN_08017 [Periplaneta americana]